MKRLVVRSTFAVLAAVSAATLAACNSLGSPAVRQSASAPRVFDASDPGVLVADGRTYLFGSTNNMRLPVREVTSYDGTLGDSQTSWARSPRNAMSAWPNWFDPGEAQVWAPSPVKIGTSYYLYFAGHSRYAYSDESNDLCIGRATSTNPMGDYVPESMPLYCGLPAEGAIAGQPASNSFGRGALDPEVVTAPDGNHYLLMALSRTRDNIGIVRLDSTGRVVGGTNAAPTILASQRFPWHDGTDDTSLGAVPSSRTPRWCTTPSPTPTCSSTRPGSGTAPATTPALPAAPARWGRASSTAGDRSSSVGTAAAAREVSPPSATRTGASGSPMPHGPRDMRARSDRWASTPARSPGLNS